MKILQEIFVPQESVNDQTLTVVGLNFATGDFVNKDDVLIELETSKAIITLEASSGGYIVYHCKIDDEVLLNALIIQIADSKPEKDISVEKIPELPQTTSAGLIPETKSQSHKEYDTQFSQKAIAILKKNNLPKTLFKHYDFVNEEVILKYLNLDYRKVNTIESPVKPVVSPAKMQPQLRSQEFLSKVSLEKLSSAKRREIEYLSAVQSGGLVSTLYIDIDTTGILDSVSGQFTYFKNSILPLVVYETSRLLFKYPLLNAFYDNGQIGKYLNINIGLAVDIDDGLKVIKLPNTVAQNILEIEETIFQLSNKYLDKKLGVSDLTDITFTITDLSVTGIHFFTPLVNKDNSAILGISKINEKLNQCILSISFDHRVSSGKYVSSFLSELKSRIESFAISKKSTAKTAAVFECYKCLKNIADDYNDIGFIKVQTKNGEEKLICDTCLSTF